MTLRVAVWGTGNVGRPAIRAVVAHRELELAGVIVSNPDKVGRDAGELAAIEPTGVLATDDAAAVLANVDAVVYAASGDMRPDGALDDVCQCLAAGVDVVSTSIYGLLHPATVAGPLRKRIETARGAGSASVFVSGIDPGWAQDLLPLTMAGVVGEIESIRMMELFDYSSYDAPDVVRDIIGFGHPLDYQALMLLPSVPSSVWAPMVRTVAEGLGVELDDITEVIDRRPLPETVETIMGTMEAGTQGAFRFEIQGMVKGVPRIVVEHITRITPGIVPEWPEPAEGRTGEHKLVIEGRPRLEITLHPDDVDPAVADGSGTAAAGGNATAAARIVNAIPAVVAASAAIVGTLDIPNVRAGGINW